MQIFKGKKGKYSQLIVEIVDRICRHLAPSSHHAPSSLHGEDLSPPCDLSLDAIQFVRLLKRKPGREDLVHLLITNYLFQFLLLRKKINKLDNILCNQKIGKGGFGLEVS